MAAEKLLMILAGDAMKASARVRGYWIAEQLERQGHAVTIRVPEGRQDYIALAREAARHDAVFLQKRYGRYDIMLARWCRMAGTPLFFDIDDAPSRALDSAVMARAARMMRLSRGVLAGSRALVDLAVPQQPATYLLPSGVRLGNYSLKDWNGGTDGPICLGWIGNGAHYADDLIEILAAPLTDLAARHPLRFRIVGACAVATLYEAFGAIPNLTIDFVDQVDWSSLQAVSEAVAPFDIGLYPLHPGPFNDFKCAFKALEYMASGIPVVASAVGANAEIVTDGADGYLVDTADDWVTALERLILDRSLMQNLGAAGRRKVEQRFDTANLAHQLSHIAFGGTQRVAA